MSSESYIDQELCRNLDALSTEFDSLGLPILHKSSSLNQIIVELIDNTNLLIQQHRKSLSHPKFLNIRISQLQSDITNLMKILKECKRNEASSDQHIENLKQTILKQNNSLEHLEKENHQLKRNISILRKKHDLTEDQLQHQLRRTLNENCNLQDIALKNRGKYTSSHDIYLTEINKYKHKEEIYKDTIKKLECNNKSLLEEVINLKEELLLMALNK